VDRPEADVPITWRGAAEGLLAVTRIRVRLFLHFRPVSLPSKPAGRTLSGRWPIIVRIVLIIAMIEGVRQRDVSGNAILIRVTDVLILHTEEIPKDAAEHLQSASDEVSERIVDGTLRAIYNPHEAD